MSRHEIIIVNSVCTSPSGQPQVVLARIRGEQQGKTVKLPPSLFSMGVPLAGEPYFCEFQQEQLEEGHSYRTLRNAKLSRC